MRFACRFDLDFVGLRVIVVVVVLDVADFAEINIILSLSWRASGLKAGVWRQLKAVCICVRVHVC